MLQIFEYYSYTSIGIIKWIPSSLIICPAGQRCRSICRPSSCSSIYQPERDGRPSLNACFRNRTLPPPRVQEAATLRVDSQTAYIIVIKYLFTVTFTVSGNHFYFCMNHFLSLEEPRAIKGRLTPGQSNGIHTESRSTLCHPLRRNILSSLHSFTELSATEPWSKLTRITFCRSSWTTGSRHVSKTSSAWFIVLYTETMNMYICTACLTHLVDLRI